MTIATKKPPTNIARHDSHHVKPRETKDATVAQVPVLSKSDPLQRRVNMEKMVARFRPTNLQQRQRFRQLFMTVDPYRQRMSRTSIICTQMEMDPYLRASSPLSAPRRERHRHTTLISPLLDHTWSGATLLSSFGKTHAFPEVNLAFTVEPKFSPLISSVRAAVEAR